MLGYDLSEAGIGPKEKVPFEALSKLISEVGTEKDAVIAYVKEHKADFWPKHITREDIFASINYLVGLYYDVGTTDDIDHLGNRRLRCVGELLQNQMRIGFSRIDKIVKERMTIQDSETLTPEALINIRPGGDSHPGILRLLPALPVHGPEQPPCRADPQAPYFGIGSRRFVQRPGIL